MCRETPDAPLNERVGPPIYARRHDVRQHARGAPPDVFHQRMPSASSPTDHKTDHVARCCLLQLPGTFAERATDNYVIMGVPANFLPFGDVPFLFLLWGLNVFLMKKVFGKYW